MLFWNACDLERKLAEFQAYYNAARCHASLKGHTPVTFVRGRHCVDVTTIREIRLAMGLSQRAFAARLQIPLRQPADSHNEQLQHGASWPVLAADFKSDEFWRWSRTSEHWCSEATGHASRRTRIGALCKPGGWNLSHGVVRLFLRTADPGALILSALIR
jgi:hypothetical protein